MTDLVIGSLAPGALLGVVILMILTDRLVTRRRLEDMERDRDFWRTAAVTRAEQVSRLLPAVEMSTAYIEATLKAAQERS